MTDQPPTDLGTVWTIGQRRQPGGSFPAMKTSGGSGGVEQEEVSGDPEDPDPSPPHPCDDPATALEWNADAAAAQTTKDLKAFAHQMHPAEAGFNDREYGAALW